MTRTGSLLDFRPTSFQGCSAPSPRFVERCNADAAGVLSGQVLSLSIDELEFVGMPTFIANPTASHESGDVLPSRYSAHMTH